MDKESLRHLIKERLKAMPLKERMGATKKMLRRGRQFLRRFPFLLAAFYMPLPDEPAITPLILWWQRQGRRVALPRVLKGTGKLEFREVRDLREDLEEGAFGILEPKLSCPLVSPEAIPLVVVPGCAFDERGNRLGRGLGFYDRFLKTLPPSTLKIAFAFERQIVPSVPTTPNDVPINVLITEARLLCFQDRGG